MDTRVAKQCKERLGIRDIRQGFSFFLFLHHFWFLVYGMTELGGPSLFACIGCDNIEGVRPLPGVIAKV